MAEIGAWFVDVFLADAASLLVYAAIVCLFVLCLVKCVAPVAYVRRVLRRAVRSVKQGENSKRSWQDEKFLGSGALHPHWREYLNNLFFADGEFHNPSNIEDFINEETAVRGPGRSQLAEAAPGLMVSLGFLGTLIGISMGLKDFNMDDAEQVMGAIRRLVPGMQYAFNTSIVGVVGSISLTLITRAVNGSALSAMSAFYDAMGKYAGIASVDPMTQIAIYQQEQTALIQNMAADLTGAMAERMAGAMDKSFQSLGDKMNDFMTYSTREQLRGVDIIVQRFLQQMNASVNGQFINLENTIAQTCEHQRQMNTGVESALEGLKSLTETLSKTAQISDSLLARFDGCIGSLGGAAKMSEEAYQRVSANVEHLELVARQQNTYLQSIGKLQGEFFRALDEFQKASDSFMQSFGQDARGAADSLRLSSEEIKKSSDLLAANHKALVAGVSKDVDRAFNTYFKNLDEAVEHARWMIEDIKNAVGGMPEAVDNAANLYAHQADRLDDALRRFQETLDETADRLLKTVYPNR